MGTVSASEGTKGNVFSIERYAVHDGGGIRTIVYLKGCPLRCLWCANPEGQEERRQLFFFPERCIACGRCVTLCRHGASSRDEVGTIAFDPIGCQGCGGCVEECYAEARKLFGREMTVDAVMEVVLRDRPFYRQSGGGVTVSGGEPTVQWQFVRALLAACHAGGIHTAMETCGYAPWPHLAAIAEHLDLALYDLKHMDTTEHRRLTGAGNQLVLANLRHLAEKGVAIVVRVPVVPGCNDSPENIASTAAFVAALPNRVAMELLPYHAYGSGKYARCGREYELGDLAPPGRARMEELAALVRAHGLDCTLG
jgi:pyruvate formate lyase activating enzyme